MTQPGDEPCKVCGQLSRSAWSYCRDHGYGRPQRASFRAQLDASHLYTRPKLVAQGTAHMGARSEDLEILDVSASGLGVQYEGRVQHPGLDRLAFKLESNDGYRLDGVLPGQRGRLCWEAGNKGGFELWTHMREEAAPKWLDVVNHLLLPYAAPVLFPDERLWSTMRRFCESLGRDDQDFHEDLVEWLKPLFAEDVETVHELGCGRTIACYSTHDVLGRPPPPDEPLAQHERAMLESISRLSLGDTLFLGHQAGRRPDVQDNSCRTGLALIRHAIYWMEYRHLLQADELPEVEIIAGLLHDKRGMVEMHAEYSRSLQEQGREAETVCRPIKNFRIYAERVRASDNPTSAVQPGPEGRLVVRRLSDLGPALGESVRARLGAVLDARGPLYRQVLALRDADPYAMPPVDIPVPANPGERPRSIRREREVFVACLTSGARSEPIVALVCDTIGVYTNVSGILDVVRPFSLRDPDLPVTEKGQQLDREASAALLRRASEWFLVEVAAPKRFFVCIEEADESFVDAELLVALSSYDTAVVDELGAGYQWGLRRTNVGDWLDHVDSVTRRRAGSDAGKL